MDPDNEILEDQAIDLYLDWCWRRGLQDDPPDYDPERWLPLAAACLKAHAHQEKEGAS